MPTGLRNRLFAILICAHPLGSENLHTLEKGLGFLPNTLTIDLGETNEIRLYDFPDGCGTRTDVLPGFSFYGTSGAIPLPPSRLLFGPGCVLGRAGRILPRGHQEAPSGMGGIREEHNNILFKEEGFGGGDRMKSITTNPINNTNQLERTLRGLHHVKQRSRGWTARCPAHDDNRNSLSIGQGKGGRVLLHCHAGCEVRAIVEAMGLRMADLFPQGSRR